MSQMGTNSKKSGSGGPIVFIGMAIVIGAVVYHLAAPYFAEEAPAPQATTAEPEPAAPGASTRTQDGSDDAFGQVVPNF